MSIAEFWSVDRIEEFKGLLESHQTVTAALGEMSVSYGRDLDSATAGKRFRRYYGRPPSAFLAPPAIPRSPEYNEPDVVDRATNVAKTVNIRPTAGDPLERHGFGFDSSPENDKLPTLQGQKAPPLEWVSPRTQEGYDDTQNGYYSLAFLADVHLDPAQPLHPSWLCAKRFVADKQPDVIVLGGDFLHMASLSHWDLSKRGLVEGRRYAEDVALANRELDDLQNANPSAVYHFLEGNHEAWCRRYVEQYPELTGHMGLVRDLSLEERGIQWLPENDVLKVGKMRYLHGWYFNAYHAKKTALQLGASCMYGHVHKPQVHTVEQRCRGQIQGISVGCLCGLNPRYRRGQPTNWLNGFGFVEYRESGEFQANVIGIVNGKMTFAGESWAG
jgi:predicted phosphodiesterase